MAQIYDAIGQTYVATRQPDPRIAAQILAALGDVDSVANIGAGTGSYEPPQTVVAIEPSQVMLDQRPVGSAAEVQAAAERLPLRDGCVDAAMASLTIHHWSDLAAGIAEMKRIARRRLVFFTWREDVIADFWLLRDYFPIAGEADRRNAIPVDTLVGLLGEANVEPVSVPHDCTDGFGAAYWRRPEAYLDPQVRAGMSFLARLNAAALDTGLQRLETEIASGEWNEKYGDLLALDTLDLGYCLVIAEL
jgi:SAM-dependent methyltransferase